MPGITVPDGVSLCGPAPGNHPFGGPVAWPRRHHRGGAAAQSRAATDTLTPTVRSPHSGRDAIAPDMAEGQGPMRRLFVTLLTPGAHQAARSAWCCSAQV